MLVICLLAASFTGCLGSEDVEVTMDCEHTGDGGDSDGMIIGLQ